MSALVITPMEAAGVTLGVEVKATLTNSERVQVPGLVTGTNQVIVRPTSSRVTEVPFTIDLVANADITPANTYWLVEVGGDEFLLEKGAGSETLEDALAEDLEPLDPTVAQQLVVAAVAAITAAGAVTGPLDNLAIAPDAVTATQIATDAVTTDAIADDAVGTAQIAAAAVDTAELADAATTNAKIADANVTMPKLLIEDEDGRAFRFDPTDLPDADLLPAPWKDARDEPGLEDFNDRIGIRDGKFAEVEFRGPNYATPIPVDIVSGWRGLAYVDLPWSDGFRIRAVVDNTVPEAGGGPMACFVPDDVDNAIGSYIVPPLSWHELGPIGMAPPDFRYLDTCPSDLVFADPANVVVEIFVLHGWVWSMVDGVRRCGPVRLPEGLVGSRRHGVQVDYAIDTPLGSIGIPEFFRYDGPVALDYPPATITGSATATKGTAATSRAIPIPDDLIIGDQLGMWFAASATITTPTGWDLDPGTATAGSFRLRFYTHTVDGTEAWFGLDGQTLTVTHGSSVSVGHIVKLGDANPHRPCTATLDEDLTNDTTATIPSSVAWGPHRSSMIAVAVPADRTVTFSTGWTPLAATAPGGAAITLAIAMVADWSDPPAPLELSEDYVFGGRETGVQTATLSSASTCLTGHVMVGPDQEGAPA